MPGECAASALLLGACARMRAYGIALYIYTHVQSPIVRKGVDYDDDDDDVDVCECVCARRAQRYKFYIYAHAHTLCAVQQRAHN